MFAHILILILANSILINAGFLCSFLLRYGLLFPNCNFMPYRNSFVFLTLIYLLSLAVFGIYRSRFKSSWELFKRVLCGLFLGTLLSIAMVYVFRIKWGAFPTTIFLISFCMNLLLIFKFNQAILKYRGAIKKRILVVGKGNPDEVVIKKADVEQCSISQMECIANDTDIDEIVVCGNIPSDKDMSLVAYFSQKMNAPIIFSPACYVKLLSEKIHGNGFAHSLATFAGRKKDVEEFLMRALDITASVVLFLLSLPLTVLTGILIKLTSQGPVFYTQERVGKDGEVFKLFKFRTMVQDAEKYSGPVLATKNDPRITAVGRFLRSTRLDEFPQLINVILGQMSLVGPRPERMFFVQRHKALMEIRLAIRPGLTGLAQIRNAYDLHPKHKIKYDYLYIQRRSFLLNLYILAKTIPVMLLKKGT